jgi:hypothetical protein
VVLIGAGKLANEVLPFLGDDGRTIDQWGRTAEPVAGTAGRRSTTLPVSYHLLESIDTFAGVASPAAVVVAAPVTSDLIERVASCYPNVSCVIDLRGEMGHAPIGVRAPIVTLQDLFARMSAMHGHASRHLDAARAEIASRSRRYELRDELRPFGWDDLCA